MSSVLVKLQSKKFLEARGGKLLLLAGTDRLDTELTIGQMQGDMA